MRHGASGITLTFRSCVVTVDYVAACIFGKGDDLRSLPAERRTVMRSCLRLRHLEGLGRCSKRGREYLIRPDRVKKVGGKLNVEYVDRVSSEPRWRQWGRGSVWGRKWRGRRSLATCS